MSPEEIELGDGSLTSLLDRSAVMRRLHHRLWRAIDYLSIFIFILVVYVGAVITDYALFFVLWTLVSDDVKKYPLVAMALDYARIGLALLLIMSGTIHGLERIPN